MGCRGSKNAVNEPDEHEPVKGKRPCALVVSGPSGVGKVSRPMPLHAGCNAPPGSTSGGPRRPALLRSSNRHNFALSLQGTLIKMVMEMEDLKDMLGFSVSHTTRAPRPGEKDGVDYHFATKEVIEVRVGPFVRLGGRARQLHICPKKASQKAR